MTDPRDERRSAGRDDRHPASSEDDRSAGLDDARERNPSGSNRARNEQSDQVRDGQSHSEREPSQNRSRAPTSPHSRQERGQRGEHDRQPGEADPGPQRKSPNRSGGSRRAEYLLDIASSVLIVAAVGALLFAASGVWPPLVAIESGSMEPHIQQGDLVFVMEEERFPGPGATADSGVVTAQAGRETGYRMFEGYGDVIVYQPDGSDQRTPIIHRAMFFVEKGENWYDRADQSALGTVDDCESLANCPAPHAGFVTKGDNNQHYDQAVNRISGPVKPEWVMGTAEVRVPLLGEVRLQSGQAAEQSANRSELALNGFAIGF